MIDSMENYVPRMRLYASFGVMIRESEGVFHHEVLPSVTLATSEDEAIAEHVAYMRDRMRGGWRVHSCQATPVEDDNVIIAASEIIREKRETGEMARLRAKHRRPTMLRRLMDWAFPRA